MSVVRISFSISDVRECAMSTKGVCSEAHLIFAKALKLPLFKHHSYLDIAMKARFLCLKAVKSRSLWNSVTVTVMWRFGPSINITLKPRH